jgi:hypothetical protein
VLVVADAERVVVVATEVVADAVGIKHTTDSAKPITRTDTRTLQVIAAPVF